MAKKIENLTHYDVFQLQQSLYLMNDGRGKITEIAKMLKLIETLKDPHKAFGYYQTNNQLYAKEILDSFNEIEKKSVTQEMYDKKQYEIWDTIIHKELVLEDDQFAEIISAFNFREGKGLFPRHNKEEAKRIVELKLKKLDAAQTFSLNDNEAGKSNTPKK
ncbi:hypothetical protein ACFL2K_00950 [Candidatus Margulisiibacteriota bacterium]